MRWIKKIYHLAWAEVANIIYGRPSQKIKVIGITGTKGKTTSAHLTAHLLKTAGIKTALLSSVSISVNEKSETNLSGNTMPGRGFIQKWLRQAVRAGACYAVMEVTSQGVEQNRHRLIKFVGAAFTNLHPEHIEAHGSWEKYREAKLKFFRETARTNPQAIFFINKDDAQAAEFKKAAGEREVVQYSGQTEKQEVKSLPGELNRANVALARAIGKRMAGLSEEQIKTGLVSFPGVPGRMEFVQKEPFTVVIDYAYTPESVKGAYEEFKKYLRTPESQIITVFGSAGGGRDKWKRPKLGEIAERYCQKIILTTEEPYNEEPMVIINEIAAGIKNKERLKKIVDRREAIREAIKAARAGDVVALLGKGAEPYIHYQNRKEPWNERREAEAALKAEK